MKRKAISIHGKVVAGANQLSGADRGMLELRNRL
jgi:hypothetical protein